MAVSRVICSKNNVEYSDIRKAMCNGARTREELVSMAGICNECEGCKNEVDAILTSVCGCKGVSLKTVVDCVNSGVKDLDKVVEITLAGSVCGRCKKLIENIIEIGR